MSEVDKANKIDKKINIKTLKIKLRAKYDNKCNIVYFVATIIGAVISILFKFDLNILFIFVF